MEPIIFILILLSATFSDSQNSPTEVPLNVCDPNSIKGQFRIHAGFIHEGNVTLFGGDYKNNKVWMVKIDPLNTTNIINNQIKFNSEIKTYFNWNTVPLDGPCPYCPGASVVIYDRLYLFGRKESTVFRITKKTGEKSEYQFQHLVNSKHDFDLFIDYDTDISSKVRLYDLDHIRSVMRYVPNENEGYSVFKAVFEVHNMTHLPRVQENFFRLYASKKGAYEYLTDRSFRKYMDIIDKFTDIWTEVPFVFMDSQTTFGYRFHETVAIPTLYTMKDDEAEEIPLMDIATNTINKKYFDFPWHKYVKLRESRLQTHTVIPVEKFFGCSVVRYCMSTQIDAVTKFNETFYVVLVKNEFYFIQDLKQPLNNPQTPKNLFLPDLQGLPNVTENVDTAFTDEEGHIFFMKDDLIQKFETVNGKFKKLALGLWSYVFAEDVRKKKAVYIKSTNNLYVFNSSEHNSRVLKFHFKGVIFQEKDVKNRAKLIGNKPMSEVNYYNPSSLDAVFEFQNQIYYLKDDFIASQSIDNFYEQKANSKFVLLTTTDYFGCKAKTNHLLTEELLEHYSNMGTPKPAIEMPPTVPPTNLPTETSKETTKKEDTTSSTKTLEEDTSTEETRKVKAPVEKLEEDEEEDNRMKIVGIVSAVLGVILGVGFGIFVYAKW